MNPRWPHRTPAQPHRDLGLSDGWRPEGPPRQTVCGPLTHRAQARAGRAPALRVHMGAPAAGALGVQCRQVEPGAPCRTEADVPLFRHAQTPGRSQYKWDFGAGRAGGHMARRRGRLGGAEPGGERGSNPSLSA